jgi:NADPH:quinone reductase-like Zn-dependent oxidoreductase
VAYAGSVGGYSEVRLIEADRLARLPDAICFDEAAAMMLQGMTAQVLIRQVYPVKAGDLILVHAAAGGTGLILCQWAAALGATVIGTVSTEAKAGYLCTLARLFEITRIDGDLRTIFRSNRPYCSCSSVAEGFAVSNAPNPLPLHRATRRA